MWITFRVAQQRAQAAEMVHGMAQGVPGGVAELVRVRAVVIAPQRAARRWPQALGARADPGSPRVGFIKRTEQLGEV